MSLKMVFVEWIVLQDQETRRNINQWRVVNLEIRSGKYCTPNLEIHESAAKHGIL
jgi:hypothetical protein